MLSSTYALNLAMNRSLMSGYLEKGILVCVYVLVCVCVCVFSYVV
jgi:hypothetical protein